MHPLTQPFDFFCGDCDLLEEGVGSVFFCLHIYSLLVGVHIPLLFLLLI